MEFDDIEKLIEKYLEANTTLEEEKLLQEYFNSDNVALHLQEYKGLFVFFKQNRKEVFTKKIIIKTDEKRKNNKKWIAIAASITLLCTLFVGKQEYEAYQQKKQFAQIKEALQMVSSNLHKGNEALYAISNNLNKGKEAIDYLYTYEETVHKVIDKVNH